MRLRFFVSNDSTVVQVKMQLLFEFIRSTLLEPSVETQLWNLLGRLGVCRSLRWDEKGIAGGGDRSIVVGLEPFFEVLLMRPRRHIPLLLFHLSRIHLKEFVFGGRGVVCHYPGAPTRWTATAAFLTSVSWGTPAKCDVRTHVGRRGD